MCTVNNYYCYITNVEAVNFFKITFKHSTKNKIKIYLFGGCNFNNYEFVQSILINRKEWVYHYYTPFLKNEDPTFSNLLIIGLLDDTHLLDFINFLNPNFCINDVEKILNVIGAVN
jgi:hypothetical protein